MLVLAILSYDYKAKHHTFFGPLNMGVCRGLNLLLGMSFVATFDKPLYVCIPIFFIFAVTLISQGEVNGNNKKNILFAGLLYCVVLLAVVLLHEYYNANDLSYIAFLLLFTLMVFLPLIKAYRVNQPKNIMKAVKFGVLSLVVLDAALATAFAGWQIGVSILILLPLSLFLAKAFAVT